MGGFDCTYDHLPSVTWSKVVLRVTKTIHILQEDGKVYDAMYSLLSKVTHLYARRYPHQLASPSVVFKTAMKIHISVIGMCHYLYIFHPSVRIPRLLQYYN